MGRRKRAREGSPQDPPPRWPRQSVVPKRGGRRFVGDSESASSQYESPDTFPAATHPERGPAGRLDGLAGIAEGAPTLSQLLEFGLRCDDLRCHFLQVHPLGGIDVYEFRIRSDEISLSGPIQRIFNLHHLRRRVLFELCLNPLRLGTRLRVISAGRSTSTCSPASGVEAGGGCWRT